MNLHPYPHQLTAAPVTKPALNAGYIAFDKDGDIRSFRLTDRATLIADLVSGEIEEVARVFWLDPENDRCVDRTAYVIQEIWDLSFQSNRGEEIPGHLQALYDMTMPRGYIGQSHYVDVW